MMMALFFLPTSHSDSLQCFDAVSREEQPACKNWVMRYWCGYRLERGADCLRKVSWCHCRPKTPSSLASFKSRLVLPFWYQLTQVVLEKRPLNGCSVVVVHSDYCFDAVGGSQNRHLACVNFVWSDFTSEGASKVKQKFWTSQIKRILVFVNINIIFFNLQLMHNVNSDRSKRAKNH